MKRQFLNVVTCAFRTRRGTATTQRNLIRPYVLTPIGAERVLHRQGAIGSQVHVVDVSRSRIG